MCVYLQEEPEREPWVYLKCGHLHSYHEWKGGPKESDSRRTCPVCREVSILQRTLSTFIVRGANILGIDNVVISYTF